MSRGFFANPLLPVTPQDSVSPFCTGSGLHVQSHPHFLRAIVYIHILPHSTYLYGLDIYRNRGFSHQRFGGMYNNSRKRIHGVFSGANTTHKLFIQQCTRTLYSLKPFGQLFMSMLATSPNRNFAGDMYDLRKRVYAVTKKKHYIYLHEVSLLD